MVICLGRGEDLHMAQLMPLPLTVSCFSKIPIGFSFLVLAHSGVNLVQSLGGTKKIFAVPKFRNLGGWRETHCFLELNN